MRTAKPQPTNIEVSDVSRAFEATRSVSCDYDGARYHFWIRAGESTLSPDTLLYKNPPADTAYGAPGYFNTRTLRIDGAVGRAIVPVMMARYPILLEMAQENERKAAAAEVVRVRAAKIEEAKRDAGPALFDAILALGQAIETGRQWIRPAECVEAPLTAAFKLLDEIEAAGVKS